MKADLSSAVETLVNTNENRLFPVYSLDPRSYTLVSLYSATILWVVQLIAAHCSRHRLHPSYRDFLFFPFFH